MSKSHAQEIYELIVIQCTGRNEAAESILARKKMKLMDVIEFGLKKAEERGRWQSVKDEAKFRNAGLNKGLLRCAERLEGEAKFQREQFCTKEAVVLELQAKAIRWEAGQ